jgi:hypothetical protein
MCFLVGLVDVYLEQWERTLRSKSQHQTVNLSQFHLVGSHQTHLTVWALDNGFLALR